MLWVVKNYVMCRNATVGLYVLKLHKQNWLQFLLAVKAAALKHQISKFYTQILCAEVSYHIYRYHIYIPVSGLSQM